jgi:hypothetical protein
VTASEISENRNSKELSPGQWRLVIGRMVAASYSPEQITFSAKQALEVDKLEQRARGHQGTFGGGTDL